MPRGPSPKYQPLADYLAALPQVVTEAALTFAEIEALLGTALPTAAALRQWWVRRDRRAAHTQAWRLVGWQVTKASLRFGHERVTFARVASTA